MTRKAQILWLVLLFNVAMASGVLAYGLGNIPFSEIKECLNWFGMGALLSAMTLLSMYMTGMDTPGEGPDLEDASPSVMRTIMGVVVGGALAVFVFVKGIFATISLLTG
jgi:hypothetical protein